MLFSFADVNFVVCVSVLYLSVVLLRVYSNYQKVDDKVFVCKLSKNVKSKLYYIENSKTRGQTV